MMIINNTMTPREKANDILDSFWLMDKVEPMITEEQAKQCALIAVDEIITQYNFMTPNVDAKSYWINVKQEIETL